MIQNKIICIVKEIHFKITRVETSKNVCGGRGKEIHAVSFFKCTKKKRKKRMQNYNISYHSV